MYKSGILQMGKKKGKFIDMEGFFKKICEQDITQFIARYLFSKFDLLPADKC